MVRPTSERLHTVVIDFSLSSTMARIVLLPLAKVLKYNFSQGDETTPDVSEVRLNMDMIYHRYSW